MSHVPNALEVLARAAELRAKGSEASMGWADRRSGVNGYRNSDADANAFFREAEALESTVIIKVVQLPVFEFHVGDCLRAKRKKDREEFMKTCKPEYRRALEEVINFERTGIWSHDMRNFFK